MLWKKNQNERSSDITRRVAEAINLGEPATRATLAAVAAAKPQVAVLITHGMGQQVPFETLDAAAEGLARAAMRKEGAPRVPEIRARTVQIGDYKTQRAEFDMRDASGKDVEVHVYEGYWAPITEGQVNLRDVMSFLVRGGLNGLRNCVSPFYRWIFGGFVSFGTQNRAVYPLLLAWLMSISLIVMNLVIGVAGTGRVLGSLHITASPVSIPGEVFSALTSVAGLFVAYSLCFGALLFILCLRRWFDPPSKSVIWRFITAITQIVFMLWVLLTIASAALLALLVVHCISPEPFKCEFLNKHWFAIWAGLVVASWIVRQLLVQFPGDVAAYISSHTLDRFNDIRIHIKKTVADAAKAIYSVPEYGRVALVGHSLGSIITYDTMNALINDDVLTGAKLRVLERTKLLVTFGCPLDKTAFIFATQHANTTPTREALAASLQPLILQYVPFRNINWINVHAGRDFFSGALNFYDDRNAADYTEQRRVHNVEDPDALIPGVSHVEYWNNVTLFDQIYDNL